MAAHTKNHDYHLVDLSPWPLLGGIAAFILAIGGIVLMHADMPWLFWAGVVAVLYVMFGWWSDVVREAETGHHTPVVQLHHRYGMILFIGSEVMFFVAWFWAYFDAAFYPDEIIRKPAPPLPAGCGRRASRFRSWHLPLFNTLVLLLGHDDHLGA